nr:uncharacterized protein LOC117224292 [Megalopta genalis]XP_033332997.1 uncharacterized protein LOC117224292 [Megalopta genalis]XP_033332998.1 uncharacterized protein LOC117224292 [Megalopta genalis]
METGEWTVLQFVDDGTVEAVPSTWIDGDRVNIYRNGTFDNCMKARGKTKTIEDTHLQSEIESTLHKRKRKQNILAKSDGSCVDEECTLPKIKQEWEIATPQIIDEESLKREREEENYSEQCSIGNQAVNTCCKRCLERDSTLKTIIEQNHLIRGLLTDVLKELRELKDDKKKAEDRKKFFLQKFPQLQFPLRTEKDISTFENILNNREEFEDGVQELYKMGGDNCYQFVKRVLATLITNDLALQYSWMGRKAKKAFNKLNTANLIICAAEKARIAANRKDTEMSIQQWLKRASDRTNVYRRI